MDNRPQPCEQPTTLKFSTAPELRVCHANAVGTCPKHGRFCAIHSLYRPFGDRVCDACRRGDPPTKEQS